MGPRTPKDTQQELMERSLTNVRGLLDKIEAEEKARRKAQKWVIVSIAAVTVLFLAVVGLAILHKDAPSKPVVTAPRK